MSFVPALVGIVLASIALALSCSWVLERCADETWRDQ